MGVLKDVRNFLKNCNNGEEGLETVIAQVQELRVILDKKKAAIQDGQEYIVQAQSGLERDLAVIDVMESLIKQKARTIQFTNGMLEKLKLSIAHNNAVMKLWMQDVNHFNDKQEAEVEDEAEDGKQIDAEKDKYSLKVYPAAIISEFKGETENDEQDDTEEDKNELELYESDERAGSEVRISSLHFI
jgi:hypothetical protein